MVNEWNKLLARNFTKSKCASDKLNKSVIEQTPDPSHEHIFISTFQDMCLPLLTTLTVTCLFGKWINVKCVFFSVSIGWNDCLLSNIANTVASQHSQMSAYKVARESPFRWLFREVWSNMPRPINTAGSKNCNVLFKPIPSRQSIVRILDVTHAD